MTARRKLIAVVSSVVLVGTVAAGVVYGQNVASQDQPGYTIEECKECSKERNLRAYVRADLADKATRDRYAAQQRTAAEALAKSGAGQASVQVTFKYPISVEEARDLARNTGLSADLVTF